jgi:hypothetical protein
LKRALGGGVISKEILKTQTCSAKNGYLVLIADEDFPIDKNS